MIEQLLQRRLLILLGKGGVGKTALSAALALVAARRNINTIAVECDERAPLGGIFGASPGFEPVEIRPGLSTFVLEGRHSLEEYLRMIIPARAVLGAVFASKLYQYFVNAAPGLRELMMLGKLYYEIERKPGRQSRRLIVFDAPSSGQAISLLKMPMVARETFGEGVVGREAANVNAMLRNTNECALIQVTSPEPLSLSETLETHGLLREAGLEVSAVFLTKSNRATFTSADVKRMAKRSRQDQKIQSLDYALSVAAAELERIATAAQTLATLRRQVQCPIFELRDHQGASGIDLVELLASDLSSESNGPKSLRAGKG